MTPGNFSQIITEQREKMIGAAYVKVTYTMPDGTSVVEIAKDAGVGEDYTGIYNCPDCKPVPFKNGQCTAHIWAGPGGQSKHLCNIKTPLHREHYVSSHYASWVGLVARIGYDTYMDAVPCPTCNDTGIINEAEQEH